MLVAKNDETHNKLAHDLAKRLIKRKYYALVYGCFDQIMGTIKTYLGKSKRDRKRMTVRYESGKLAITHYRVITNYHNAMSLVECTLETGRTHQIRLHMEHKKHPIVGDPMYGRSLNFNLYALPAKARELIIGFKRQALHAKSLEFIHPGTGEEMQFEIPLPADIEELIKVLGERGN
jgi:23S rRNA pseudouridine1911/1915/1917 synthase